MRALVRVCALALVAVATYDPGRVSAQAPAPVRAGAAADGARLQPDLSTSRPVYVVYYWRARPGRSADYSEYIRTIAEPIDEEARKAGVFEEVQTYTPAIVTGAPGADWTHMRVFRLRNFAALDTFSAGLDEAGKRRFPDEQQRKANAARAAELRDLLRQEIWKEFR